MTPRFAAILAADVVGYSKPPATAVTACTLRPRARTTQVPGSILSGAGIGMAFPVRAPSAIALRRRLVVAVRPPKAFTWICWHKP